MQIVQGISDYYKSQGKVAASENYKTQVKKFFQWCEANGYDVGNLPSNSVENYLNEAGYKITTTYLMRAQLKSALREASEDLQSQFDKAFIKLLVGRLIATNEQLAEWDLVAAPPVGPRA